MASVTGEINRQLKRKLEGLTDEEKTKKIKEIALQEEMKYWRAHCLRAYRDKINNKIGEL